MMGYCIEIMRFRIHLQILNKNAFLPVDYQYAMSAAIYKLISHGDEAYSRFLHNEGYSSGGLKHFKLFTFSALSLPKFKLWRDKGVFELIDKQVSFVVSFMADQAAEAFVKGMFVNQQLSIGDRFNRIDAEVSTIEALPRPVFSETMEYRCLSPLTLSIAEPGKKHATYLEATDSRFGLQLFNNLISKSLAFVVAGADAYEAPFESLKFELLGENKTKLIAIKAYTDGQTRVRGNLCTFRLTAPVFLHELGYYGGFGEGNAMGFGCGEAK